MSSYNAVLLDMDGVIVDSEKYWQSKIEKILNHVTEADVPLSRLVGRNPHEQYDLLCSEYKVNVCRTEYLTRYSRCAESIYREKANLMGGFEEVIDTIKIANVPIGLVSSSPPEWIAIVLDEFNLTEVFDVLISGHALDIRNKPSPDIYQRAAAKLNVEPSTIIAVEDTLIGVDAAVDAGLYCIAYCVNKDETNDFDRADEIIQLEGDLAPRLQSILI